MIEPAKPFAEPGRRPHHVTSSPVCQPAVQLFTEARSLFTTRHLERLPDPTTPEGGLDPPDALDLLQPTTASSDASRS